MNVLFLIVLAGICGYFLGNQTGVKSINKTDTPIGKEIIATSTQKSINSAFRTFKFNSFHGQDLGGGGFEFEYPTNWRNDGQYFSPQKISYYDINSVDAPIYYDLISEDIVDTSDTKYQITHNKRFEKDSEVKVNGVTFKKYSLLDSQSQDSDKVLIYIGPKITIFGSNYFLVFRWEEKPLGITITGNDVRVIGQMVGSIKFNK